MPTPPLTLYFARLGAERVPLKPAQKDAVDRILGLLDLREHRAQVAKIHEAVFPLAANTASANASLNTLLRGFNEAAEAAGQPIRMVITATKSAGAQARWVWFEGPAEGPRALRTPDLNAIPPERLIEQRGMPLEPAVILLTVNPRETEALLRAFVGDATPRSETLDGVTYNHLGRRGGLRIIHVICEMGSGGVGASQAQVQQAINTWQPQAVIAVGIAFGMNKGRQHIGDVLISEQIRPYQLGIIDHGGRSILRSSRPDASKRLLNRIRTVDQSLSISDGTWWPRLRFGVVLSGNYLVDNMDYRERLRALEPEAEGGEMEAAGLYAAAHGAGVDWIVVKGISDWADGQKHQDMLSHQQLAARNAATVVWRILEDPGLFDSVPRGAPPAGRPPPRRARAPRAEHMGLPDLCHLDRLVEDALGSPATLHKDREEELSLGEQGGVDVLGYLLDWLREPGAPPLFALLGEYGMGKTITSQRLARQLDQLREQDPRLPIPLYFDLRNLGGLRERVPTLHETVEQCVRGGWHGMDGAFGGAEFDGLVDEGALVIFDGLDEVLVKMTEADGQIFTNHLIKLLSDARARRGRRDGRPPRLLITCRTQYFRTLRDQRSHFTGQERGEHGPEQFRALVLLPFTEAQVRGYLCSALPGADPERLIELIRSVHDLQDLSRRPYTLRLVAEFIPEIEADRAAGRVVNGVTLYRRMVRRWLDRDSGKHHIQPEHKQRLAAWLAAEIHRRGGGLLPAIELEGWFHAWLESQPDLRPRYARLHPEQLEEDLRTATFLARQDGQTDEDAGFRFAHTSLQEFFLADYLLDAVRQDQPQRWTLPSPSQETLDFLGQMLEESPQRADLMGKLQGWRKVRRGQVNELILSYAERARRRGWPVPILHGIDLRGADLRGLRLGEEGQAGPGLELGPAILTGANLREARLVGARLEGADLRGAKLEGAEFLSCKLTRARFEQAEAAGAVFRACTLAGSRWEGAGTWRTRFVFGAPEPSPAGALLAPWTSPRPPRARLEAPPASWGSVLSCAWSPDGRRLVSAGDNGTVRLWDAVSGEEFRALSGHRGIVRSCAWSPDGGLVVSAGNDGTVRVWDAASGEEARALSGHRGTVRSCAWSPDGGLLVSAGNDGTVRVWNALSSEEVRALLGHRGIVRSCAWSPGGGRLVSSGEDGTVRVWDAVSGEELQVLSGHRSSVLSCAWSPDGGRLVSSGEDGTVRVWDAVSGEGLRVLSGHQGIVRFCAWSPDGGRLVSSGEDGTVRVWDALSGEETRALSGHRGIVRSCAISSDSARVVSSGEDGAVRVWDASSGKELHTLLGHRGRVWSCAISSNSARVVSSGEDGTVRVWDALSGEETRALSGHEGRALFSAISSDGGWVVSSGDDGTVRLWDASSGEELHAFSGNWGRTLSCAISSDGARVVSSGEDGTVRLWDALSGEEVCALTGHLGSVLSCAFSSDGGRVVSAGADVTVRVWDAVSGGQILTLSGHRGGTWSCAFSSDSGRLVSAGADGMVRLWGAASGEQLRVLTGHRGGVLACSFSPDGSQVVSAGSDGTLRLWDATTGACLRIHATLDGETAVWDPRTNTVIEASEGAWRWLHWQIWDDADGWMPVPLESFGPVPAPRRLAPHAPAAR